MVPLLDLQLFLFFLRTPFFFFSVPNFLGAHSVFSLLTFCLLSVEVTTLTESTSIPVYLMTWTGYDSWHCVFLWQLLCHLSIENLSTGSTFTFNRCTNSTHVFPQNFHSVRGTTMFSWLPNSKLCGHCWCVLLFKYIYHQHLIFFFFFWFKMTLRFALVSSFSMS